MKLKCGLQCIAAEGEAGVRFYRDGVEALNLSVYYLIKEQTETFPMTIPTLMFAKGKYR